MKNTLFRPLLIALLWYPVQGAHADAPPKPVVRAAPPAPSLKELEVSIRAHLGFLASDALGGRGSGTQNELIACEYVAAQFGQWGIEPAGDADASGKKTYLQTVAIPERRFTALPQVGIALSGGATWTHGKEVLAMYLSVSKVEGELQHLTGEAKPKQGAVVLATLAAGDMRQFQRDALALLTQGASAVLVEETPALRALWKTQGTQLPPLPRPNSQRQVPAQGIVVLNADVARILRLTPGGTKVSIGGAAADTTRYTRNVIGVLRGNDTGSKQAVLLSAHIDHLGERTATGADANADTIYNGADDDASGVVAVLELARALSSGPRPKRTVYFACFGSEETGGAGAAEFLRRPPTPLENIVCNLEFEMIGRPDPKVAADQLWLTGYERSDLGPELQKQGARIVPDPHPRENFFFRSDNIQLARRGVVAQTVSSFGLHPQYHRPDDDLAHIDFGHMTRAIASLIKPARFLANSNFVPQWVKGKRP